MQFLPLGAGIFDPLYNLFGWCMHQIYLWLGSYGWTVIVFALGLKTLMLPLSLKGRKGMLRQTSLQAEIAEIRRLYPKDPQKQQQMQTELLRVNGISPGAGCLSSLINLFILLAIFQPIQHPLHYIAAVPNETMQAIGQKLVEMGLLSEQMLRARTDIPILSLLTTSGKALSAVVKDGLLKLEQLLNLDFFGINLGLTPTLNPKLLFGSQAGTYLPLLIFPILTLITMLISMKLMKLTNPTPPLSKEEKEREKRNPAKAGQSSSAEAPGQNMMKSMNIFMPILMIFTSFRFPTAMAIYWVVGNIFNIIETLIFYYFYVVPFQRRERENTLLATTQVNLGLTKEQVIESNIGQNEKANVGKSPARKKKK